MKINYQQKALKVAEIYKIRKYTVVNNEMTFTEILPHGVFRTTVDLNTMKQSQKQI